VAAALVASLAASGAAADAAKRHRRHHRAAKVWVARKAPGRLFPSLSVVVPPAPAGSQPDPAPDPPSSPDAPPPAPPPLPSRTGVDLDEYSVYSAYAKLAAGPVELNVTNFGMDDHDLTVESADHTQLAQVYLTPGAAAQVNLTLAAGSYRLYCSLYNGAHDQQGMHTQLVVE
jgi:hypothetical protein